MTGEIKNQNAPSSSNVIELDIATQHSIFTLTLRLTIIILISVDLNKADANINDN